MYPRPNQADRHEHSRHVERTQEHSVQHNARRVSRSKRRQTAWIATSMAGTRNKSSRPPTRTSMASKRGPGDAKPLAPEQSSRIQQGLRKIEVIRKHIRETIISVRDREVVHNTRNGDSPHPLLVMNTSQDPVAWMVLDREVN